MSSAFYLGAYWGQRHESPEACGDRLAQCLTSLASHTDVVATWYLKANRKAEATQAPVSVDADALTALLRLGQNRRDTDGTPIIELGFSAALWNGDLEHAAGLMVQCGAWSPVVSNRFVLDLPSDSDGVTELFLPETARDMLRAVINSWEPEWATWTSDALREVQKAAPGAPVFGWMTYLSSREVSDADVPAGVEVEPFGAGVLVTLGERPGDISESLLVASRDSLA